MARKTIQESKENVLRINTNPEPRKHKINRFQLLIGSMESHIIIN